MVAPAAPELQILLFPLMAPGHIIPITHMATLFARRGVGCTIVTTPTCASLVRRDLLRATASGHTIALHLIELPSADVGLPHGLDSLTMVTSPETNSRFFSALELLRPTFERLLRERRPDAVVTDMFLPWTAEVAAALGVARLVFHGMGFFPLCVLDGLDRHAVDVLRDVEAEGRAAVPGLPHRVELRRSQLHDSVLVPNDFGEFMARIWESEANSYGAVVNSFYELEPEYADHHRNDMKRKAWHVGPVSLFNRDETDMAERGAEADASSSSQGVSRQEGWLAWLDSKDPGAVIYVCFGSLCRLTTAQLSEIAVGLESSGHPFIWVVRNGAGDGGGRLPEGLEERYVADASGGGGNGFVMYGWAPQVSVLGHRAVGGFMTHCGWNSVMEAVAAGLPMVTWPLSGEQFYNERLVVEVLGVGVPAGAEEWGMREEAKAVVGGEKVAAAVARVMGSGEEAEGMRRRAAELEEKARRAVEAGGSSFEDLGRLLEELTRVKAAAMQP